MKSKLTHDRDYRHISYRGIERTLGVIQGKVMQALHEASRTEQPWLDGKVVLSYAGSESTSVFDLFKPREKWIDVIESDDRGKYRLRP